MCKLRMIFNSINFIFSFLKISIFIATIYQAILLHALRMSSKNDHLSLVWSENFCLREVACNRCYKVAQYAAVVSATYI